MTGRLRALGTLLPTVTLVLLAALPSRAQTTQPVSITSVTAGCPLAFGTTGNWSASAVGGVQPLFYKFWLYNETTNVWTLLADYRPTNGIGWRPSAPGTYRTQVWVRSATSSAAYDVWQNSPSCTVSPAPSAVVTALSASPPPPDASGAPVTWTAVASGGAPPLQYRFLIRNEATQLSSVFQDWSPATTAVWTPPAAGTYTATVEVRSWATSGPAEASRTSTYLVPLPAITTLASQTPGGTGGNSWSTNPALSADGRFVAFESYATDLVPGDTNSAPDVVVRDRVTGITTRVSVATGGAQANYYSLDPAINADGRFVAFMSLASNLAPDDARFNADVFVHDRQTTTTTRVSVASDGTEGDAWSGNPSISADGRFVAFVSLASNLVPGDSNGVLDAFVHDTLTRTTERASLTAAGAQVDAPVPEVAISGDGRFVAYVTTALNILPGATGFSNVYLRDRQTGSITRISTAPGGAPASGNSNGPSLSADGRYLAYSSSADNLVAGDSNGQQDVFVYDRINGRTVRASEAADGTGGDAASDGPALSADGRFVAFQSSASNLVPGDTNGQQDAFLRELATGAVSRVSVGAGGAQAAWSGPPSISGDGRVVAFTSDSGLQPGGVSGNYDVFVRERGEAARPQLFRVWSEFISQPNPAVAWFAAGSGGPVANEYKFYLKQQGGGWTLLRDWGASPSFVWASPPPGTYFVEVWARTAGSSTLYDAFLDSDPITVLPSTPAALTAVAHSACPAAVGRWVATTATATGGTQPLQYAFYLRQPNGSWTLVQPYGPSNRVAWLPQTTGSYTVQAWVRSAGSSVPQESTMNAFCTATDPPPVTGVRLTSRRSSPMSTGKSSLLTATATGGTFPLEYQFWVRDDATQQWTLLRPYNATPIVSWTPGSGTYTLEVWARSVGSPNAYDVFADLPMRVVPSSSDFVSISTARAKGDGPSGGAAVSADGLVIAFESAATNLVVDTNGVSDVFVRDRGTGVTTRVSVATGGTEANGPSHSAAVSADGRYVAFVSDATNLVANDTNGVADVFVRDRITGITERISAGIGQANGASESPSISADGRFVAFASLATNLVAADTNVVSDIFLRDRIGLGTTRVSVGPGGTQLSGASYAPSISADGRFIAFDSEATTLVAGDTNGAFDVFVSDRLTSTTTRVSVATGGAQAGGNSYAASISADGRYVAFESAAPNLVPSDTNATWDVFVRDRTGGTTVRASVDAAGGEAAGPSWYPSLSRDGRVVAFQSTANDLTTSGGDLWQIYLKTLPTGAMVRVSEAGQGPDAPGSASSFAPSLSGDGRIAAFTSLATNIMVGDVDTLPDVFVRDTGEPGPPSVLQVSYASGAWTTYAAGGQAALEYKFYLFKQGVGWSLLRTWGAANSVNWVAPGPGTYYVQAWVRTSGSLADVAEAALNSATVVVP